MKASIAPCVCSALFLLTHTVRADLLAYFGDGVVADAAAFSDLAGNSSVIVSALQMVDFQDSAARITRTEFGAAPFTPAGPTAGSGVGSEWFFARANVIQSTPSSTTDYFGFTVSAIGGTLELDDLVFDRTSRANEPGGIITTFDVFVSVDSGAFNSFGSDTITDPGTLNVFGPATTQTTDLSSITGASSVEVRIALGDNSGLPSKSSWAQGIQLNGTVVPEPGTTGYLVAGMLTIGFLRRIGGAA